MTAPAGDVRTVQARALGDPSRSAIFRDICDAAVPLGVAELASRSGLHHNAVRQHLAKLRDAGLVVEETSAPRGPGRPSLRYRPAPGAADRWDGSSPYEELAMLLLDLLGGATPFDAGMAGGRRMASELGYDRAHPDAAAALESVARRLGFEPHREDLPGGVGLVLERCPFADAAAAAPDVVCELHRGLAAGIAGVAGGGAVSLLARPPRQAGCLLRVADAQEL